MKKIISVFKWDLFDLFRVLVGSLLFCVAINFFVVPNNLYTGGILGLSQLIRSLSIDLFNMNSSFDFSGVLYYLINIPLFIVAYKSVGKTFFFRTLFAVSIQSLMLSLIPNKQLVDNILTNVLVGGILGGVGVGMILSSGASTGGTDIVGLALAKKNNHFSVGKLGLLVNTIIYVIAGLSYGLEIMIYSIIYSFVGSLVSDHTHKQNICSYVMIFTKENPHLLIDFIKDELHRDCTYWEGYGGFDQSKTYISYSAMSKYELQRLERHIHELSPNAFMIKSEGIGIDGNFQKKLVD